MRPAAYLLSIGLAGLLLSVSGARLGVADDAGPRIQRFTAAQLEALVAHPADGMAFNQFLKGPGSEVYIIRRDKDGDTEVHMAFNDIYFVESGRAKITVGGRVTGNRETAPTEWRGGEISGGTDYPLAPGDVLFIPAGIPHKVLVAPKASITYATVKTPK
jgi:mannose-6-phosphate isomerase-like protein (cupin superfamily)